jgi:excinuclease ABC subunit C
MQTASQNLNFEKAAQYRDILFGISKLADMRRQSIDFRNPDLDCDVFAICEHGKYLCFTAMNVRNGNLIIQNNKIIPINAWNYDSRAKLIADYYATSLNSAPQSIALSQEFDDETDLIINFISQRYNLKITATKREYTNKLVKLAQKNCLIYLSQQYANNPGEVLGELADICLLPKVPVTIEAFDISNLGDKFCIAASVRFYRGEKDKSNYRRFKIKYVEGQNDFAMMKEAIIRRLDMLLEANEPFPDLLLIDGGKGQLSSAQEAVSQYENPPMLISLAKKEEIIISPYSEGGLIELNESHPVRRLMQRIRDEVHRFAITYHRKIRGRQFNRSVLQDIDGIGAKKAAILLKTFGSVKEISQKSIDDLIKVKGITVKNGEKILAEIKNLLE